jgi:hypothetical protein
MPASQIDLTPQLLTLASALLRTAHPEDQSLARALMKAEERLPRLRWSVEAGVLEIQSYTTPGLMHHVDDERCSCKTSRGWCWHRAAYEVVSVCAAAGVAPISPAATRPAEPKPPVPRYTSTPRKSTEAYALEADERLIAERKQRRTRIDLSDGEIRRRQEAVDALFN